MEFTLQDMDECFASPSTAEIWRELWVLSKEIEGGKALEVICDGRPKFVEVACKEIGRNQEAQKDRTLYSQCQGDDQFLAQLHDVNLIRFATFHGRWVQGCIAVHLTEPFVLATCFFIRKDPQVYISELDEVNELFASAATTNDLKKLWASFKNFEGGQDFKRIHIGGDLVSALHFRGIWEVRIAGMRESGQCFGAETFLASLENLETIRVGMISGQNVTGIIVAHVDKPFIEAFFFLLRK